MNTHEITLDVSKEPAHEPTLYLGQGDMNGTTLVVNMFDNGEVLDLTGLSVKFCMRTPDMLEFYEVAGAVSGNVATFQIDETYAAGHPGNTDIAYVQVIDGDTESTSTARMRVVVLPSAKEGVVPAPAYKELIDEFIEENQEAVDEIIEAAQEVLDDGIPLMTSTRRGGAKLGNGLEVGADERLGVKVDGTTITIGQDGALHGASTYSLPTMSATTKGGAQLGQGLKVDSDTLSLGNLVESGSGAEVVTDGCAIYSVDGEGWATQDGTPTPSNPVPIEVARGRNLLDESAMTDGYYINDSGVITSATGNRYSGKIPVSVGETCSFSVITNDSAYKRVVAYNSSDGFVSLLCKLPQGTAGGLKTETFTIPANTSYVRVSCNTADSNVQLELGSTPSPYVPYGHVGLEVQGRNLVNPANYNATAQRGLSKVLNADGSITVSGTATSSGWVEVWGATLEPGEYTASSENGTQYSMLSGWTSLGSFPRNFTVTDNTIVYHIALYVTSGNTYNFVDRPQIELGSTVTDYEPYHHTTTPIPLPLKSDGERWAGGLPDGTVDDLVIDSAGRYEWTAPMKFTTQAVTDGVSGTVGVDVMSSTGQIADGATVLYASTTPTTEHGYISDWPSEIPEGAVISCPELQSIGVSVFVPGAREIAQHVSNVYKRIEAAIAEVATS